MVKTSKYAIVLGLLALSFSAHADGVYTRSVTRGASVSGGSSSTSGTIANGTPTQWGYYSGTNTISPIGGTSYNAAATPNVISTTNTFYVSSVVAGISASLPAIGGTRIAVHQQSDGPSSGIEIFNQSQSQSLRLAVDVSSQPCLARGASCMAYLNSTGIDVRSNVSATTYTGVSISGTGVAGIQVSATNITYSGTLNGVSDRRVKDNIQPLPPMLDTLMKLQPVSFERKDTPGVQELGFIAQDVYPVLPDVVNVGDENKLWGMQPTQMIAPMVRSIQDIQLEIESLKDSRKTFWGRLKWLLTGR